MLNYPKVGRRPLQSDYRISSSEIESYKKAKDKYEEEKRKRAEKNSNSSFNCHHCSNCYRYSNINIKCK